MTQPRTGGGAVDFGYLYPCFTAVRIVSLTYIRPAVARLA